MTAPLPLLTKIATIRAAIDAAEASGKSEEASRLMTVLESARQKVAAEYSASRPHQVAG